MCHVCKNSIISAQSITLEVLLAYTPSHVAVCR